MATRVAMAADLQVPRPLVQLIGDTFAGFAGSAGHPCLGARSVVHRSAYTLRVYAELGSHESAAATCASIESFVPSIRADRLSSFVAVYAEPVVRTEEEFSRLLWTHLQRMHDLDSQRFAWDPRVSSDPEDPRFSLSMAGNAFFVVGLHPTASRWARRFPWPALVFNPHEQFTAMRRTGRYDRMRSAIRDRDGGLQGSVNPVLRDHGLESEARQYAGEEVLPDWQCPLVVRST